VDFLNVGPWELVLVLIIAILVAGPKRMVEIAHTLGQYSRQLRDLSREFTKALQAEIEATEEEAGRASLDLRQLQRDVEDVFRGGSGPDEALGGAAAELREAQGDIENALTGSPHRDVDDDERSDVPSQEEA
jgi:Sec-independent protein translocase protein TatA